MEVTEVHMAVAVVAFIAFSVLLPVVLYGFVAKAAASQFRKMHVEITGEEPHCWGCPFRRDCWFANEDGGCKFTPLTKKDGMRLI